VNFRLNQDSVMKSGYIHEMHIEKGEVGSAKILVLSGKGTIPHKIESYKGERLSLKFKDTDIRDIIMFLCEIGGINVAFDPGVSGNISCELRDVPWDQALDVILKTNRLGKSLDGDILRIGKTENLIEQR
jgi:type II secretory pathway component HofQ